LWRGWQGRVDRGGGRDDRGDKGKGENGRGGAVKGKGGRGKGGGLCFFTKIPCKGVRCPPIFSLYNLINVGWL